MSDVTVFCNTIVVLTPNYQILDCVTIAFGERHDLRPY